MITASHVWKFPKGSVEFIEGSPVRYTGLVKSWKGKNYQYTYVVTLFNGTSYEGPTNEKPSRPAALRKLNMFYRRAIEEREFFV